MITSSHRLAKASVVWIAGLVAGCGFVQGQLSTLNGDFKSVAVTGSRIIALSENGQELLTSDDSGVTFDSRETMSDTFNEVSALGTTAVSVGVDALVLRSVNSGTTWLPATAPTLAGQLAAAAGRTDGANPNKWIAVGDDGFDGSIYRSTDDGANWSEVKVLTDILLSDVVWTGTRWLVCGRDGFLNEGIVYSSTDGLVWTGSVVPVLASPLLALAHDGSGTVLAVGEDGQMLQSVDDGLNFSAIGTGVVTGDLQAVIYSGGEFIVGGDEKTILEVSGSTVSQEVPPAASADPVLALYELNGSIQAVGSFESSVVRTIPFALSISEDGLLDFRLTINESLSSRTYFLESSTDLENWAIVDGTSRLGTDAATFYDVSDDGVKRFWRAVEF